MTTKKPEEQIPLAADHSQQGQSRQRRDIQLIGRYPHPLQGSSPKRQL